LTVFQYCTVARLYQSRQAGSRPSQCHFATIDNMSAETYHVSRKRRLMEEDGDHTLKTMRAGSYSLAAGRAKQQTDNILEPLHEWQTGPVLADWNRHNSSIPMQNHYHLQADQPQPMAQECQDIRYILPSVNDHLYPSFWDFFTAETDVTPTLSELSITSLPSLSNSSTPRSLMEPLMEYDYGNDFALYRTGDDTCSTNMVPMDNISGLVNEEDLQFCNPYVE